MKARVDPIFDAASRRAAPAELDGASGRIAPGKGSALFTVLASAALVTLIVLVAPAGWPMVVLGGVFLLSGLFMLPSLTRWHDVRWDEYGITGTSRVFGPTLGWSRARIAWPEIVRADETITGYWYVEAADGRRVYWSYLYPGYPALAARLRQACPNLYLGSAKGLE